MQTVARVSKMYTAFIAAGSLFLVAAILSVVAIVTPEFGAPFEIFVTGMFVSFFALIFLAVVWSLRVSRDMIRPLGFNLVNDLVSEDFQLRPALYRVYKTHERVSIEMLLKTALGVDGSYEELRKFCIKRNLFFSFDDFETLRKWVSENVSVGGYNVVPFYSVTGDVVLFANLSKESEGSEPHLEFWYTDGEDDRGWFTRKLISPMLVLSS